MKKKILIMFTVVALLSACGSNKSKDATAEDTTTSDTTETTQLDEKTAEAELQDESQDEPEELQETRGTEMNDGLYTPPFRVTVINEYRDGAWINKDTYVFNVLKQGRLNGTSKYERRDFRFDNWEELGETTEFGGKWSTTSISMGDGRLKVYSLDRSDRESSIYLPATCDYIWMCDYAWLECENWNLNKALKVTSVEKL